MCVAGLSLADILAEIIVHLTARLDIDERCEKEESVESDGTGAQTNDSSEVVWGRLVNWIWGVDEFSAARETHGE